MEKQNHPHFDLDFSTREFLRILPVVDHVRLRDWDRRGMLPNNSSQPRGRGVERRWGFGDVVSIGVFALLVEALPDLQPAHDWTPQIVEEILDLYATGPDGDKCDLAPIYYLPCDGSEPPQAIGAMQKVRTLATATAWRPSILIAPGAMAIELYSEIRKVLDGRGV